MTSYVGGKQPTKHMCRHCGQSPGNWRKGLCRPCWSKPDIRRQYGSQSKYGRRGTGNSTSTTTVRAEPNPTAALPGTEEKIRVLTLRAERNELLWHPRDRRWDEEVDWEAVDDILKRKKERLDEWNN